MSTALRTRRGRCGALLALLVLGIAFIGPLVGPGSPDALVTTPFATPTPGHLLGGDVLGRDVLARVLAGGRVLLLMTFGATCAGVGLGSVAGVAAAYLGDRVDNLIMRAADLVLSVPLIVFALLLISTLGTSPLIIVLAIGLGHVPQVARVIRSATLDIVERDFVRYGDLLALKRRTIMLTEIAPNLVTPLTVEMGLRLTFSAVTVAGLAYLGFGPAPPAPTWAAMINENFLGLQSNPWAVLAPAALIAAFGVGVSLFTDAVARVSISGQSSGSSSHSDGELAAPGISYATLVEDVRL